MPKKIHRFKFKGYDHNDDPIIEGDQGMELEAMDPPDGIEDLEPTMVVYRQNPTWIRIGGRWYCIGC